jgi:hypothetical protein
VSEDLRILLELVEHSWVEMDADERARFEHYLCSTQPYDFYIFLRHARRVWSRRPASSSQTLAAVREIDSDRPTDPPGDDE